VLQPAPAGADDTIEIRELVAKALTASGGDGVGLAAVLCMDGCTNWANPAAFFEARDRTVQGPGTQADASEAFDVHHHCVAVFVATSEAR
jgi:hypothetical protein